VRTNGGHALQEVPASDKLVDFLSAQFDLNKGFVRMTYGPRVARAVQSARDGAPEEILQITEYLLSRLTDGRKIILDDTMGKLKGTAASDADLDDLIKHLQQARGTKQQIGAAPGSDKRAASTAEPRSRESIRTEISRNLAEIPNRLSCYKYCKKFQNWNLDDSMCLGACDDVTFGN
jgi:hypothetical protein